MLAVENITVNTAIQVRTRPEVTPQVVKRVLLRALRGLGRNIPGATGFAWARGDNLS